MLNHRVTIFLNYFIGLFTNNKFSFLKWVNNKMKWKNPYWTRGNIFIQKNKTTLDWWTISDGKTDWEVILGSIKYSDINSNNRLYSKSVRTCRLHLRWTIKSSIIWPLLLSWPLFLSWPRQAEWWGPHYWDAAYRVEC